MVQWAGDIDTICYTDTICLAFTIILVSWFILILCTLYCLPLLHNRTRVYKSPSSIFRSRLVEIESWICIGSRSHCLERRSNSFLQYKSQPAPTRADSKLLPWTSPAPKHLPRQNSTPLSSRSRKMCYPLVSIPRNLRLHFQISTLQISTPRGLFTMLLKHKVCLIYQIGLGSS